jgi:hypothetical protein
MDCITPSNAVPIPKGESLDIYQLFEKLKDVNLEELYGKELPSMSNIFDGFDDVYWEQPSQILPSADLEWIKTQMSSGKETKQTKPVPRQKKTERKIEKPIVRKERTAPIIQYTCEEVL